MSFDCMLFYKDLNYGVEGALRIGLVGCHYSDLKFCWKVALAIFMLSSSSSIVCLMECPSQWTYLIAIFNQVYKIAWEFSCPTRCLSSLCSKAFLTQTTTLMTWHISFANRITWMLHYSRFASLETMSLLAPPSQRSDWER